MNARYTAPSSERVSEAWQLLSNPVPVVNPREEFSAGIINFNLFGVSDILKIMAPKAKPAPHRLGPPPQLTSLKVPVLHQQFANKVAQKRRAFFLYNCVCVCNCSELFFVFHKSVLNYVIFAY